MHRNVLSGVYLPNTKTIENDYEDDDDDGRDDERGVAVDFE